MVEAPAALRGTEGPGHKGRGRRAPGSRGRSRMAWTVATGPYCEADQKGNGFRKIEALQTEASVVLGMTGKYSVAWRSIPVALN